MINTQCQFPHRNDGLDMQSGKLFLAQKKKECCLLVN